MLTRKFFAVGFLLLMLIGTRVQAGDDPLLFTREEMAEAYRYQQYLGARLHRPLNPEDCFYGKTEFIATFQGREFSAPCKFIRGTIRHLKEALGSGVVKYLFPLDAGHASLGVPLAIWEAKYKRLPTEELLPAFLKEPKLAALYQTSGYLDAGTSGNPAPRDSWGTYRTIVGFYDGRPSEISPPRTRGTIPFQPEDYRWINGFVFLASSLGELQLFVNGTFVSFDIAFDNDRGEVRSVPVDVSAVSK